MIFSERLDYYKLNNYRQVIHNRIHMWNSILSMLVRVFQWNINGMGIDISYLRSSGVIFCRLHNYSWDPHHRPGRYSNKLQYALILFYLGKLLNPLLRSSLAKDMNTYYSIESLKLLYHCIQCIHLVGFQCTNYNYNDKVRK
jgi:hypothetical protein